MNEIFITYKKSAAFPDEVPGACRDISPEDFSLVLDFLLANGEKACVLTGNEPSLHARLEGLLAVAREKRILVILETGGLFGEDIKETILKYAPVLRWKAYHPSVYPEDASSRLLENLSTIARQIIVPAEVSVVIHNLNLDYNSLLPIFKENTFGKVRVEIVPSAFREAKGAAPEQWKGLTSGLRSLMEQACRRRAAASLGCGVYPCIFSDEEFGFLSKMGAARERCLPRPGVLPDLRVYHCRAFIRHAERGLFSFGSLPEAMTYFFERFGQLQRENRLFEECGKCLSHSVRFCYGGCLAEKEIKVLEEIRGLIQSLKTQEKADTWFRLGKHYSQLEKIPEAEEAFLAAKGLSPVNARVCLELARVLRRGKKIEQAEKQYRQALCLQPQNTSIIVEFSKLLYEQAKFDQAIDLLEKAVKSGKPSAAVYFELANNYMKKGMRRNALSMLEQIRQVGKTI